MLAPIDRTQTTTCISVRDDAIDWDRSERARDPKTGQDQLAYLSQRLQSPASWRDCIKLLDGKHPTEFIIGMIPSPEMNRLEDECRARRDDERTKELFWRAFIHGLRDIKGWPVKEAIPKREVDGIEYVTPDWIQSTFVGRLRHVANEIGLIVYFWNSLSLDDVKN